MVAMTLDPGAGTSRARAALAYLRRHITSGDWPVGSRIPVEADLAEDMQVGRSTVREAVRSLAAMGMLETLPGRGTFVRSSTPTSALLGQFLADYSLEELLSYRRALQIEAAQQAAIYRSDEDLAALQNAMHAVPVSSAGNPLANPFASRFMNLLFDAARNRLLASLHAGIAQRLDTPDNRARLLQGRNLDEVRADYRRILEAVTNQDFIDAAHAMVDHADRDLEIYARDGLIPPLHRGRTRRALDGLEGPHGGHDHAHGGHQH